MYQEFALRFLQGAYASADPNRGRFRNFLRTILVRLVTEYHRKKGGDRLVQIPEQREPVDDRDAQTQQFTQAWRDELLKRSWTALAELERTSGRPLHLVMDQRVAHPELSSAELADRIAEELNKPMTAANLRVLLHRARQEFANILLAEVSDTLEQADRTDLEDELIELNLHKYCRPALSG